MNGPMCGMDQVLEWAEGILHPSDTDVLPERMLRRLRYMKEQAEGAEPRHFKGLQGPTHDYEVCGECGHVLQIDHNYCPCCGYRINWPTTRCLLPLAEGKPWGDEDYEQFFRKQADELLNEGIRDENVRKAVACRDAFRYRRIKKQEDELIREQRETRTKRLIKKIERDEEQKVKRVYYSDEVIKLIRKCKEF